MDNHFICLIVILGVIDATNTTKRGPIMVHTRFAFFRREFYIYVSDLFLRDKITQELFVLCCLYMHRSVVPDIPPYNPLDYSYCMYGYIVRPPDYRSGPLRIFARNVFSPP